MNIRDIYGRGYTSDRITLSLNLRAVELSLWLADNPCGLFTMTVHYAKMVLAGLANPLGW